MMPKKEKEGKKMNNYNFKLKNTLWAFIVTILLFTSSFTSAFNAPSVTITKPAFDPNAPSSKEILNIPVGVADMDALKAKGEPGEETGIYTWAPVTTPNQMNPAFGADNGTPTANTCAFRGDYAGTYTVKVSYKEGADGATVEDTSSGDIHVVKAAAIEYLLSTVGNWTTGDNVSTTTGSHILLRPKFYPTGASWPAGQPVWEITDSPTGSTVVCPTAGTVAETFILDKEGLYAFKITCGTSVEYINVEAKTMAINISALDDDSTRFDLQSDTVENNMYYCKATLSGGSGLNWCDVTFAVPGPTGTVNYSYQHGYTIKTTWTVDLAAYPVPGPDPSATPPSTGAWNVSKYVEVTFDDNQGAKDADRHDFVKHRPKELNEGANTWVPDGLLGNWQHIETVQAPTQMSTQANIDITHSLSFTQAVGSSLEAGAKDVLKAKLGLSESFGTQDTVTVGAGRTITAQIPTDDPGSYYGIFTNVSNDYKLCPATKWEVDGSSSSWGTVKVIRQNALCDPSAHGSTSEAAAYSVYPVYNAPGPIPVD